MHSEKPFKVKAVEFMYCISIIELLRSQNCILHVDI